MVRFSRLMLASILAVGIGFFAMIGSNDAQEKKPYEKHDASALNLSLREVINTGAKMFNEQGDHAGCYRLYHGSLLAVRPFLSPDLQKSIDTGIAGAEKLPTFSDRAFELRKVLDDIRSKTQVAGKKTEDKKVDDKKKEEKKVDDKKKEEKKVDDKKKEEKKVDDKKKEEKKVDDKKKEEKKVDDKKKEEKKVDVKKSDDKKVEEKKKDDKKVDVKKSDDKKVEEKKVDDKKTTTSGAKMGQLAGKVEFAGKAVAGGYLVALIGDSNKKFSSPILKDGTFQFKSPIPAGNYRVAIEAIPGESIKGTALPERYRSEKTSGLSASVDAGKNNVTFTLVN